MGRKKSPTLEVSSSSARGKKVALSMTSASPAATAPPATANNTNNLALAAAQILQQAQHQSQTTAAPSQAGTASAAAPGIPSSVAAKAAADTFQTLASLMNSSAVVAAAANQHLLPNSTPVSSLLPQISAMAPAAATTAPAAAVAQQQQEQQNVITSQLAALLNGVGSAGTAAKSPATPSHFPAQPLPPPAPASTNPLLRHPIGAEVAAVAAAASAAVPGAVAMPNMQNWTLEQLQQHIQLLEQIKQPVPQTVSLLLSDAKRKEQKRNAKRIANRKSASTSRARKKAYVQEMTELNARLKRQALILSLLPDMVIVIGVEGDITFCSAQVERVLRYDMKELEGVNLSNLLIPASKEKLNRLIKQLSGKKPDRRKTDAEAERKEGALAVNEASDQGESNVTTGGISSGAENSATDGGAAVVSEPSFPLSVVQVGAKRDKTSKKKENGTTTDTSDTSTYPGKQLSSLTVSNSSQRSATAADLEASKAATGVSGDGDPGRVRKNASSDMSNSSSLSTDANNVQQANTNLERNVRIHNKKMKFESGSGYTDDVTGAEVTANNATARLSSLQHRPEASSSEEDSGYRESNDSREETSSLVSDSSGSNGRRKPIAPTCNICLIRKDLTTIWCEVTSSVRTKEPEEDAVESVSGTDTNKKARSETNPSSVIGRSAESEHPGDEKAEQEVQKELLLCLRPVRDGDQKMQKKISFEDGARKKLGKKRPAPDSSWNGQSSPSIACGPPTRPFKKRGMADISKDSTRTSDQFEVAEIDTDAAESLMLMNKKP